jgi:hypothetical protein
MSKRRTTVMVDEEALATLGFEASRRNIALAAVVREAIDEKAVALRARRRPRVGIARSTDRQRTSEITAEPVAEAPG